MGWGSPGRRPFHALKEFLRPNNHGAAPLVGERRPQLTWVYRNGRVKSGTVMRGLQLSSLARQGLQDTCIVEYAALADIKECVGHTLFLTPSVIRHATFEELDRLRRRRNTLCLDFLDYPPSDQLIDERDVLISSSIRQHELLRIRYPKNISHMITHHVDPEIDYTFRNFTEARIGYFGELGNARYNSELRDSIDFHQTNNSENPDRSWLSLLPNYNCHYSVREYRFPFPNPPPDAFKPFTKGFTAARCASNLIVDRDESDALFYLGSDYPYLLDNNELPTVKRALAFVKESFGSSDWKRGLEAMREVRSKSSENHIQGEIADLLRVLRSR